MMALVAENELGDRRHDICLTRQEALLERQEVERQHSMQ
jgi:hypothetical protein